MFDENENCDVACYSPDVARGQVVKAFVVLSKPFQHVKGKLLDLVDLTTTSPGCLCLYNVRFQVKVWVRSIPQG